MAKPTIANARWASSGGANLLVPSSGLRDTGFIGSTPAMAGYVNNELHELYLWAAYIDAGVWDGNFEVSGNLKVDGSSEFVGNAVFDGNATATGYVAGSHLYSASSEAYKIPASSSRVAFGSGTSPDGSPSAVTTHGFNNTAAWRVVTGVSDFIHFPIQLPAGAIIDGWTLYVAKSSGAQYVGEIFSSSSAFAVSSVLSSGNSSATGNVVISPTTTPSITVDATSEYFFQVRVSASGAFNAGDKIGHVIINWHLPHP